MKFLRPFSLKIGHFWVISLRNRPFGNSATLRFLLNSVEFLLTEFRILQDSVFRQNNSREHKVPQVWKFKPLCIHVSKKLGVFNEHPTRKTCTINIATNNIVYFYVQSVHHADIMIVHCTMYNDYNLLITWSITS